MHTIEIRQYRTADGHIPFAEWITGLRDPLARRAIAARITRLQAGNRGDWKALSAGVFELRIDTGPGFRVYCGQDGATLVLLLCAGDKRTQTKDIDRAREYWKDYQAAASVPFSAADYLQADDIPGYLAEVLKDGDTRAFPPALRTVADVLGMTELASRTGLNRETLYRTLSESGNPRLDTLGAILTAFGMRLTVVKHAQGKRIGRNPRTGNAKAVKAKPAKQAVRKRA